MRRSGGVVLRFLSVWISVRAGARCTSRDIRIPHAGEGLMAAATRPRRARKIVATVDIDGVPHLEDTGCEFSACCTACIWRTCVHELPAADRRIFSLAWRALQAFKATPDGTIEL